MRLPRDVSARDLVKLLAAYGYAVTRQTGSHIRLTTTRNGQHHITVPAHDPLSLGTLRGILTDVATHFGLDRDQLATELFGS